LFWGEGGGVDTAALLSYRKAAFKRLIFKNLLAACVEKGK